MDTTKPRIVVLAGGISNERAVSLRSGAAVLKGLQAAGYAARLEDLCRLGRSCIGALF